MRISQFTRLNIPKKKHFLNFLLFVVIDIVRKIVFEIKMTPVSSALSTIIYDNLNLIKFGSISFISITNYSHAILCDFYKLCTLHSVRGISKSNSNVSLNHF